MWKWFWLLWFMLSAFVLAVYGWSFRILLQQKKAWKAFAIKHDLEYTGGRMTEPPHVTGRYKNHRIFIYTAAQTTSDVRGQRYITVIELELGQGLPVPGAISTKHMNHFIQNLKFRKEFSPNSDYWNSSYILRTENASMLNKYLTEERLKTLDRIFRMNNVSALFFFDEIEAVLRIETPDPVKSAVKAEKILDRILGEMEKLKVDKTEHKEIEEAANDEAPAGTVEVESGIEEEQNVEEEQEGTGEVDSAIEAKSPDEETNSSDHEDVRLADK